jgi:error-prone DNA polymerase
MGFYAPAQLLQNVRRSGVEVRPVDVNRSQWESTLEAGSAGQPALRLGLCLAGGLGRDTGMRVLAARGQQVFASVEDLHVRTGLQQYELGILAAAGALAGIAGHRYRARWEVAGAEPMLPLFPVPGVAEGIPLLRLPTEAEDISADHASMGLSLGRHPLALLRGDLRRQGFVTAEDLRGMAGDDPVRVAGLVITRQRPGSAGGVMFVTLEDETGYVNLIVWPRLAERQRQVLLGSRLLAVKGQLQRQGDVLHVIVSRAEDRSAALGALAVRSRDFA